MISQPYTKAQQVQKQGFFQTRNSKLESNKAFYQPGLTFIEVMIVVIILVGIAAIVGPAMFGKLDQAKVDQAKIQMKNIATALELYYLDNSSYPSGEQGLDSLLAKPETGIVPVNWRGPYLQGKRLPLDPWNLDYLYSSGGGSAFVLGSLGADRAEGGEGINQDIFYE